MRKTKYFLDAIVEQGKSVTYYALDLSEKSLHDCLDAMAQCFPTIKFVGLLGTYEDSLQYIHSHIPKGVRKMLLWLGSSIGNFTREEAATFMRSVADVAMEAGDLFLCGIDRRNDPVAVGLAYNDPKGLTRDFIMNGLDHVNVILQEPAFDRSQFAYVSIYNNELGRHEAYYRSLVDQTINIKQNANCSIALRKGELINVEYSYKYSAQEVDRLLHDARLNKTTKWTDEKDQYDLHLFQKPPFFFDRITPTRNRAPCPSIAEFEELWKAWDTVTRTMIPSSNYLERPIALRHPYIFYMGHIPSFLDIQVSRCLNEKFTEPQYYTTIFERGIDPDMEDPSKCHPHSQVPDTWPALEEILAYQARVRTRIRTLYDTVSTFSRRLQRVLFMCYEHEAMHLE
ncbi:hypothetical protein HK102_011674, partial [Quaeritorhiza haematococci]